MLSSEIHLVLVWEKGLEKLSHIIYDLENSFEILDVKKVIWGKRSLAYVGRGIHLMFGKDRGIH